MGSWTADGFFGKTKLSEVSLTEREKKVLDIMQKQRFYSVAEGDTMCFKASGVTFNVPSEITEEVFDLLVKLQNERVIVENIKSYVPPRDGSPLDDYTVSPKTAITLGIVPSKGREGGRTIDKKGWPGTRKLTDVNLSEDEQRILESLKPRKIVSNLLEELYAVADVVYRGEGKEKSDKSFH